VIQLRRFLPAAPACAALACAALAGCAGGSRPGAAGPAIDLTAVAPLAETFTDGDLDHLGLLLDEERRERYRGLDEAGRAELMRIFWAELDPTPTTDLNERKLEHYRRLAYARTHFAIDREPGWDRRGELLLRYGSPDQRREIPADVAEGVGVVPPQEIWVYARLGQAYKLQDPRLQNDFRDFFDIEVERDALTPRAIEASREAHEVFVDPRASQRAEREDLDAYQDPEEAEQERRLETLYARGQEAYRVNPESYLHDFGGGRLDYVFDVVNFGEGEGGATRLAINTAFWASDLTYLTEGGEAVAVLGCQAVLKTMEHRPVARRDQVTRDRRAAGAARAGQLVVSQITMDVPAGSYRMALSVQDSLSRDTGIFTTEVQVRPFPSGELVLSDIQRALDVRPGRPGDPFLRGPFQVVPYPLGTFPRDRDIYLYFEVYGLSVSPEGDCFYGVDFLIKPRASEPPKWFGSSRGQVIPGVASTFEGTGKGSTVREHIIFDPATFTDDEYDVEITVHDRLDDRSTSGSVRFAVQSR
jgi:GWxTD domain-containing protein